MKPILILDGPGCAALAATVLGSDYDVRPWSEPGTDLAGRQVQLWGLDPKTTLKLGADLAAAGAAVSILDQRRDPAHLDFGQVLAERQTGDAVMDFIRARLKPVAPPPRAPKPNGHAHAANGAAQAVTRGNQAGKPSTKGLGGAFGMWQSLGLDCDAHGMPFPNISNAAVLLSAHPQIKDRIWFDAFTGKIMQTVDGSDSPWTEAEDLRTCRWLQQALKIPKLGLQTAVNAIQSVAFDRTRNPLVEWLSGLAWDGVPRLDTWVADFLGAPQSAYTAALGRNWLVAMAARAFKPGCQADHMPVLEGKQGRGKSSALAILGGQWFKVAPQAFGSREFFETIQGAWLIEIPDMVGFGRREHSQIIAAITTRSDSYRPAYGRHTSDHPRSCVFAATSETDEYLQEPRGIRRYWPVRCGEINLEALAAARDQLFAEAVQAFKSGADWYEMPAQETEEQQRERVEIDPWMERIASFAALRDELVVCDIAEHALEMRLQDVTRSEQMRISNCLKSLGYSCKVEWKGGKPMRIYRRR